MVLTGQPLPVQGLEIGRQVVDLLGVEEPLYDIAWLEHPNSLDVLFYGAAGVALGVQVVAVLPEDVHQTLAVNVLVLGDLDGNVVKVLLEEQVQLVLRLLLG